MWVKSFGQKNVWVENFLLKKNQIKFGKKISSEQDKVYNGPRRMKSIKNSLCRT